MQIDNATDPLFVVLVKGTERYIIIYPPEQTEEAIQVLGRYAADPLLSFNWHDASLLFQRIREGVGGEPNVNL